MIAEQLINIKDILNKSNFTKKEGVAVHIVSYINRISNEPQTIGGLFSSS